MINGTVYITFIQLNLFWSLWVLHCNKEFLKTLYLVFHFPFLDSNKRKKIICFGILGVVATVIAIAVIAVVLLVVVARKKSKILRSIIFVTILRSIIFVTILCSIICVTFALYQSLALNRDRRLKYVKGYLQTLRLSSSNVGKTVGLFTYH